MAAVVATGAFVPQMVGPQIVLHFTPSFTYLSPAWQLPLVVVLLIPLIGRGTVVAPKALNLMDVGILAILPILDIAVGATVAVRRARI